MVFQLVSNYSTQKGLVALTSEALFVHNVQNPVLLVVKAMLCWRLLGLHAPILFLSAQVYVHICFILYFSFSVCLFVCLSFVLTIQFHSKQDTTEMAGIDYTFSLTVSFTFFFLFLSTQFYVHSIFVCFSIVLTINANQSWTMGKTEGI